MRKLLGFLVLGLLALPVVASDDLMQVNPSGIPAPVSGILPPVDPNPVDPCEDQCGTLAYDGVNGYAAARRPDGLESWVMIDCDIREETEIQCFTWIAVDNTDQDWSGVDDFAIWDAATVETGCADDSNTVAAGRDLANSRSGPVDFLFGRNAWRYSLNIPPVTLAPGRYYFAVRAVIGAGQSFILTTPDDGTESYFQSVFFGFPCAIPGSNVFGVPASNAIVVGGKTGPPTPRCIYQANKVKNLTNVCGGLTCNDCPYTRGDLICTTECRSTDDCRPTLKGTNACSQGTACKIKANLVGCNIPPTNCKRCR